MTGGEPSHAGEGPALGVAHSLGGRRWLWRRGEERIANGIAQRHGLPEVIGRMLAARGIGLDDAPHFLDPTLRALLPDPSCLRDMDLAAERLAHAVRTEETVAVFGDYDVDGACSAAILTRLLRDLGCEVRTYVPDRLAEGYGPNAPALLQLAGAGATLIACVDCGTAAAEALSAVQGRADVVVLDHHKSEQPPPVLATVNPNRLDCGSGLVGACAAAVTFLAAVATVRALRRTGWFAARPEPDLREALDLVALATVCDVVPLTGLNRALVSQGLKVMARRARPGLSALLEVAGIRDLPTAMGCGYALGPRINAGGRISDAGLGLQLLLTADPVEAAALAARLDAANRQRQQVEAAMATEATAQAQAQADAGRAVLLAAGAGWHPGVVGIVAGRLKERFNRPVLVGAAADGIVKGSGRSVLGHDLGAAVIAARQAGLLLTGGGHAMACGFSAQQSTLGELHAFLEERLAGAAALPRAADLAVEGAVQVGAAGLELAQQLARLAPFGAGNDEPVLVLARARVIRSERIGREGATIRVHVEGEGGGPRVKALHFRAREGALAAALDRPGGALHLAGHLRAEEWRGTVSASFVVTDAAVA